MTNAEKVATEKPIEVEGSRKIDWMYPEIYGDKPDFLRIALYHVRAANNIEIEYNSSRNGWVIFQQITVGLQEVDGCTDSIEKRKEVAFVPAWDPEHIHDNEY